MSSSSCMPGGSRPVSRIGRDPGSRTSHVADADRIRATPLAAAWRDHLNIRVLDDRLMHVVDKARDIGKQLVAGPLAPGKIEQVQRTAIVAWIVRQHVESRPTEMRLRRTILVQHVVINLTCAIDVREVDQPVAPTSRIIDREGTHKRRAGPKGLEDEPLRSAEPQALTHRPFELLEVAWLDAKRAELGSELHRVRLLQERE
ncbi:hypothetical protein WR25_02660 [Diploscapter pachys]|uniref:Uncharacterized protein n=1 Tax=Diploscapter pachys TaxID=2018661 RepID=A0A2A2K1M4_9BILA|nr:hypothetical protein WR25_02660 [Diploscapter pachys]